MKKDYNTVRAIVNKKQSDIELMRVKYKLI